MANTTYFQGDNGQTILKSHDYRSHAFTLRRTGKEIPSDAIITSISFKLTNMQIVWSGDYYLAVNEGGSVSDTAFSSDGTVKIPECEQITDLKNLSANETAHTITFTIPMGENPTYTINDVASYFKETDEIIIRMVRNKKLTSGSPPTFRTEPSNLTTCTIDWEENTNYQQPTPPSYVRLEGSSTLTTTPGSGTVELSWGAASISSEATNSLQMYGIYRKSGVNGSWTYVDEISASGTNPTFDITVPNATGTYYYTIKTITTASDYDYTPEMMESLGRYATLIVQNTTAVTAPTRYSSSIAPYIGAYVPSSSTFELDWSGASSGTGNPITGYTIKLPDSTTRTIYTSSSSASYSDLKVMAGTYQIRTLGTVSGYDSDYRDAMTFTTIVTPNTPTISSISSNIMGDTTITWDPANSNVSGLSYIKYQVYYKYTDGTWNAFDDGYTDNNYYVLQPSETIEPNKTFQIGVVAYYYALGVGFTTSALGTSNTITYITSFDLPSPFWDYYRDEVNGRTDTYASHIYNSVTLHWNPIPSSSTSASSNFTYRLWRSKNGSNFDNIYTVSAAKGASLLPYTDSGLDGETIVSYYVEVIDEFEKSTTSSTIDLKVIKPLELSNLTISNINAENLQVYFDWTSYLPELSNWSTVNANVLLKYGNYTAQLNDTTLILNGNFTKHQVYDISLKNRDLNLTFWQSLYTDVISNQNPWAGCELVVEAWYPDFNKNTTKQTISKIFSFNYTTSPDFNNAALSITGNMKGYYNPKEIATIILSNFAWADAAGGSTGATVKNYLTSDFSSNTFTFNDSSTNVLIPTVSEDKDITLTLKTELYYVGADRRQTYTSTISCVLAVARWIAETVTISKVQLIEAENEEKYLEGYLVMPEKYCGSTEYNNIASIKPTLADSISGFAEFIGGSSDGSFTLGQLEEDENHKKRLIKFSYHSDDGKYSDIKITFNVIFTNTSSDETINTLTVTSVPYRYFIADIDFAIRKGRSGLNVSKDFGVNGTNGSTLQVNAWSNTKTDEEAIVEVFTSQESADNIKTIFFALGNAANPDYIYKKDNNIFIDNLYHPPASSLTNGTLTLNFNSTGLVLSGNKGGTILTEKNYSDYFSFNPTGAITTVIDDNLTADCALISNANGKISVLSTVSSAELGYLNGVTSAIQTQLNNKLGKTETAAAATKLETGRTLKVNLASTSASTVFNGESNITDIGVSGTLAVSHGGTGTTVAGTALTNLGVIYTTTSTPPTSFNGSSLRTGMIWLQKKG